MASAPNDDLGLTTSTSQTGSVSPQAQLTTGSQAHSGLYQSESGDNMTHVPSESRPVRVVLYSATAAESEHRFWIDPQVTFGSVAQALAEMHPSQELVVLQANWGPSPYWAESHPDSLIGSTCQVLYAILKDRAKSYTMGVVRTSLSDYPIPIYIPEPECSTTLLDAVIESYPRLTGQIKSIVPRFGDHDIRDIRPSNDFVASHGSPATPVFINTLEEPPKEFMVGSLYESFSPSSPKASTSSDSDGLIPPLLQISFVECKLLVQRAYKLDVFPLQMIHLSRALLHVVISLARDLTPAFGESGLIIGAALNADDDLAGLLRVAPRLLRLLEGLLDAANAIMDNLASGNFNRDEIQDAIENMFVTLCGDLPGAVTVRHSETAFKKLGSIDCEELDIRALKRMKTTYPETITEDRKVANSEPMVDLDKGSELGYPLAAAGAGVGLEPAIPPNESHLLDDQHHPISSEKVFKKLGSIETVDSLHVSAKTSTLPSGLRETSFTRREYAAEVACLVLEALHASSEVFPPLQSAVGGALWLINNTKRFKANQKEWAAFGERVAVDLQYLAGSLLNTKHVSPSLQTDIDELTSVLLSLQGPISEMLQRSKIARVVRVRDDTAKIAEFSDRLSLALNRFGLKSKIQTQLTLEDVSRVANKLKADCCLAEIRSELPAPTASWSSERMCHRGTRSAILNLITDWALQGVSPESSGARVFWLCGVAGAGKSAIAHTIAHDLDDKAALGSCFFFTRGTTDRDNPPKLIGSMARDLAAMNPVLLEAIATVVREKDGISDFDVHRQFSPLITQPLLDLAGVNQTSDLKPIVIIWDALDECDDPTFRHMLLQTLKEEIPRLPSFVRIFITSRPMVDITSCMDAIKAEKYVMELGDEATRADINSFLTYRFRFVPQGHPVQEHPPSKDWPTTHEIEQLTDKSAGLFIWANTAALFIQNSFEPTKTLNAILSGTSQKRGPEQDLYRLYLTALRCAGPEAQSHGDYFHRAFQAIVGTITVLKIPMAIASIGHLCGEASVDRMVKNLGSVIRLDVYDSLGTVEENVQFIHPSFREFLTSAYHSKEFFVDQEVHNNRLARCCLTVMHSLLERDICRLNDPSKLNSEVEDLPKRMHDYIPSALRYACRFWIEHVCGSSSDNVEWLGLLEKFFTEKLLNWIEVISFMGELETIQAPLESLYTWLKHCNQVSATLRGLAKDTSRFIYNFLPIIKSSSQHIYISALPFTPTSSRLFKLYARTLTDIPLLVMGSEKNWAACLCVLEGHTDTVQSVAFSADGSQIVSGGNDKTVRVWDAVSGIQIGLPMTGHTERVSSVAFAPDGKRVVSASADNVLRIWDIATSKQIGSPLEGHAHWVALVKWSPDGTKIASASCDDTLRIWDAETGQTIGSPLEGHTGRVWSVAYSKDGSRIVSGGDDKTVRMWDTTTGTQVGTPMEGHSDSIWGVNISPDGSKLVSGSSDSTVRIWDVATCKELKRLDGHTDKVWSVEFSYDGKRAVSGSSDRTIRVWDVESGQQDRPPLTGHDGRVWCIAVSPDDKIASSSDDNTVRVWDGGATLHTGGSTEEHFARVWAAAFSPDGSLLASGDDDYCVRLWDTKTGLPHGMPIYGHMGRVISVAFSSDGKRLVSSSADRTVRIWDAESGLPVGDPIRPDITRQMSSVGFSSNGQSLVYGSSAKSKAAAFIASDELTEEPASVLDATFQPLRLNPDGWITLNGKRLWCIPLTHRGYLEDICDGKVVFLTDSGKLILTDFSALLT